MLKIIIHNLKHFLITTGIILILAMIIGYLLGASADLQQDKLAYKLDGEGPHVFFENDQLQVNYIRGNREDGFIAESTIFDPTESIQLSVDFLPDQSRFDLMLNASIKSPPIIYQDDQPIIAISDIESHFKTFRDFLINNGVINQNLDWAFQQGHLVLVGDFVDRGASTFQVLWLIYKLEQQAALAGGAVHFILGNHELKNLQGNYRSAFDKYFYVASIMDKQQFNLFDENSFIGRWLSSKNSIEMINGHIFVHGGLHPEIANMNVDLATINQIVRKYYRTPYLPMPDLPIDDFLTSTKTGPSWYRGYFEDPLSQAEVDEAIAKLGGEDVIVGHTLQRKVSQFFQGKVYAIDVKHPQDYRLSIPFPNSQGLLIKEGVFYRLLDDGSSERL